MRILGPPLDGLDLLDAACGTARRLAFDGPGPRRTVGLDLVFEMLAEGRRHVGRRAGTAAGNLLALPLPAAGFDIGWCRLAAGYVADLAGLYRELARILRPGGTFLVTDFHPAASRAGHTRSFRDASGRTARVANVVHEIPAHEEAAGAAGLVLEAILELAVGSDLRPFYERAGALARYEADAGLPLLVAFLFRAGGDP